MRKDKENLYNVQDNRSIKTLILACEGLFIVSDASAFAQQLKAFYHIMLELLNKS